MEYKLLILGSGLSLLSVMIGAILNYFLQQTTQNRKIVLEKKLEVYSEILSMISESFLVDFIDLAEDDHRVYRIKSKLIKSLSKGRLLANKDLEKVLREVYEKYSTFLEKGKFDDKDNDVERRAEQLMREELGSKRLY